MADVSKSVKEQMERLKQQPFYQWFLQDDTEVDSDDERVCKLAWEACEEWVKQGQEPTAFIYETVMDNGILNLYIGYQSVLNLATPNEKITKRIPLYKFPHPVVLDAQKTFVIENQDAVKALNKIISILGNAIEVDNLQDLQAIHSEVFEIAYLTKSKSETIHLTEENELLGAMKKISNLLTHSRSEDYAEVINKCMMIADVAVSDYEADQ